MSTRSENLIGKTIFGEYTITKKLGEGGMGAVYLASQQAIDQQIAIKVLHGRATKNDELVKRFNREAKAISMLTHPNIIRVFIFGRTEEGLIYLAMEFVKGISLREEIARVGPMTEMRAIKILKQSLSALAEAHDIGIVHRDLKPDNILLTTYRGEDDFVKVLDFGIAKVKDPEGGPQQKLTQAGVVYGTPEYLSPEQAQALELDHRTDIYSLGCILFEMMTGQVPFKAPTAVNILMMHVYEEPPTPSSKHAISDEMESIILKAIQKKPEARYQDTMEFFQALVLRERQLIEAGEEAEQIMMPGMEVTTAFMLPPELVEQARTSVYKSQKNADAREVENPGGNAVTQMAPGVGAAADSRRKLLLVLIILLLVLLVVIGVGIALLMSK